MQKKLWTKDFTIITLGSAISMLGNSISGFGMSLMVLDISKSTLLYAIYITMYTIPQLIVPILSGAFLDRQSRKKTIYILDFIAAALYALMAIVLSTGWFSFPVFAGYCFIIGCIQSAYRVAFDSLYPLLVTEGYYQKAYSIESVLWTLSMAMVPVSALLYRAIGLVPILCINAACFFTAAVLETQIESEEEYIEIQKSSATEGAGKIKQILIDTAEGFRYLKLEHGLLAVAIYFGFTSITEGVSTVITLPYFKNNYDNGEFVYMMVWGCSIAARAIGGMIHYKKTIPAKWRYDIALAVYITINLLEAFYLFTPIPIMMLMCTIVGFGGITSFTIRISATQSYVPDEKKGRFNGAFSMISMLGSLVGEMAAGLLSQVMPERSIVMAAMLLCLVAAVVFIGGNRESVSKIYNSIN